MASTFITSRALVAAALLGIFALTLPAAAADKPAKKPSAAKKAKAEKPKDEPKEEPKDDAEAEAPSPIPTDVTPSKATLRWKFNEGDERRYLMNQNMSMSMKAMGQQIET